MTNPNRNPFNDALGRRRLLLWALAVSVLKNRSVEALDAWEGRPLFIAKDDSDDDGDGNGGDGGGGGGTGGGGGSGPPPGDVGTSPDL